MHRMSASWARNQSKKPLLAAERMPLALKLMMRMECRCDDGNGGTGPPPGKVSAPPAALPAVSRALLLRHRPRRARRARRQDRVLHLRLLAGEGAQEGRDCAGLVPVELTTQLRGAHDRHRLLEVPHLPAVEIRRGQLDVAQRRGTE